MEKSKKGKKKGEKDTVTETTTTPTLKTCNFVKARHILCEKYSHIEEIYNNLIENYGNTPPPSEFGAWAMEKSECSSSKKGGELGYFGRGKMHGDFEKAAFSLPIGQMSEIIKTSFGYHLILVEDRKAKLK